MEATGEVTIRPLTQSDSREWLALRIVLWPDGATEHADEIQAFFDGKLEEPVAVFVAESPVKEILGFAELSIRSQWQGIERERIGYVEGLFVRPEARGRGVARKLLQESRQWARREGCTRFASDRAERIIFDKRF